MLKYRPASEVMQANTPIEAHFIPMPYTSNVHSLIRTDEDLQDIYDHVGSNDIELSTFSVMSTLAVANLMWHRNNFGTDTVTLVGEHTFERFRKSTTDLMAQRLIEIEHLPEATIRRHPEDGYTLFNNTQAQLKAVEDMVEREAPHYIIGLTQHFERIRNITNRLPGLPSQLYFLDAGDVLGVAGNDTSFFREARAAFDVDNAKYETIARTVDRLIPGNEANSRQLHDFVTDRFGANVVDIYTDNYGNLDNLTVKAQRVPDRIKDLLSVTRS